MKAYYALRRGYDWSLIPGKHASAAAAADTVKELPSPALMGEAGVKRTWRRFKHDAEIYFIATKQVEVDGVLSQLKKQARDEQLLHKRAAESFKEPFVRHAQRWVSDANMLRDKFLRVISLEVSDRRRRVADLLRDHTRSMVAGEVMANFGVEILKVAESGDEKEMIGYIQKTLERIDKDLLWLPRMTSTNPLDFPINYEMYRATSQVRDILGLILDVDIKGIKEAREELKAREEK